MKSVEGTLLARAVASLKQKARSLGVDPEDWGGHLALLELAASEYAGWNVAEYWARFRRIHPLVKPEDRDWARSLLAEISRTRIPVPLALAALAREELTDGDRRRTGSYYTDFRLAHLLAKESTSRVTAEGIWVDTACGSGTLLAAAAMQIAQGAERDLVIQEKLTGADLSANALRGTLLSVASLTDNLDVVAGFSARLVLQDSLRARNLWRTLAPHGAALVIGNPPWERLRASRHESASNAGETRRYGQSFETDIDLSHERSELLRYLRTVTSATSLQGRGDHDYYKLFFELGLNLTADDGILSLLLPAGLIRSQGTELLRRELLEVASELSISVIENRARHFAIDTRFKFLALTARIGSGPKRPIQLRVADRTGVLPESAVQMDRAGLASTRRDLSVPEVRSGAEWRLYSQLSERGTTVGNPTGPWRPEYKREVDMTTHRRLFSRHPTMSTVPLLEGRHVAQFRWRAKKYLSGEGRAATWVPQPLHADELKTQWFVDPSELSLATQRRTERSRIGFCDITGQTNERSLLAARIPAGLACGNKVPTLRFPDGGDDREDLFLALANSLVVDWMLRRVVTTTVNFFILDALPLPSLTADSPEGRELIRLARLVTAAEGDPSADRSKVGEVRTRMDALIAHAWGVSTEDMRLILRDFPLLDRGQPPIEGEVASTITADSVIAELGRLYDEVPSDAADRVTAAIARGAVPFVPAEYA